jgi:hypothetical protein
MSSNIETIVLHRAKILLQCEEHWTLGAWARDENGSRATPYRAVQGGGARGDRCKDALTTS